MSTVCDRDKSEIQHCILTCPRANRALVRVVLPHVMEDETDLGLDLSLSVFSSDESNGRASRPIKIEKGVTSTKSLASDDELSLSVAPANASRKSTKLAPIPEEGREKSFTHRTLSVDGKLCERYTHSSHPLTHYIASRTHTCPFYFIV